MLDFHMESHEIQRTVHVLKSLNNDVQSTDSGIFYENPKLNTFRLRNLTKRMKEKSY